jgi:hypothetical protein
MACAKLHVVLDAGNGLPRPMLAPGIYGVEAQFILAN